MRKCRAFGRGRLVTESEVVGKQSVVGIVISKQLRKTILIGKLYGGRKLILCDDLSVPLNGASVVMLQKWSKLQPWNSFDQWVINSNYCLLSRLWIHLYQQQLLTVDRTV